MKGKLYPRSKEKELDPELFRNPTNEYRAAPFWAWNCKLDQEALLEDLDQFPEMGMGGAHIHCRGAESFKTCAGTQSVYKKWTLDQTYVP